MLRHVWFSWQNIFLRLSMASDRKKKICNGLFECSPLLVWRTNISLFFSSTLRTPARHRLINAPSWWIFLWTMRIGLLILLLHLLLLCPPMDTFVLLSNCSFNADLYQRRAAVQNQFQIFNRTSLSLFASYAFQSLDNRFQLGLIYPYGSNDYLLPFPLMLDCASDVQSCQLKSISNPSSNAEWIRVQLNSINYTDARTNQLWNQRSFFLKQGRYQLSNCSMNNGEFVTDPRTIFSLDIQNEKSQGEFVSSIVDVASLLIQVLPATRRPIRVGFLR